MNPHKTPRIEVDSQILDAIAGASREEAFVSFNAHYAPDQNLVEEAVEILKDEANELACLHTSPVWKDLTHRAKVAICRERDRIRRIADAIKP